MQQSQRNDGPGTAAAESERPTTVAAELAARDVTVGELRAEVAGLRATQVEQEQRAQEREQLVRQLQTQVTRAQGETAAALARAAALDGRVHELEAQVAADAAALAEGPQCKICMRTGLQLMALLHRGSLHGNYCQGCVQEIMTGQYNRGRCPECMQFIEEVLRLFTCFWCSSRQ